MPEVDCTVEYRDCPGYPGYRVGNDGSVWTCWTSGHRSLPGRIGEAWRQMKPSPGKHGHLFACFTKDGKESKIGVHRLVLEAFVGLRPKGMCCRHFPDRNPANNHINNLQWGTYAENAADRTFHGTQHRGIDHPGSILTENQVISIRADFASGERQVDIARKNDISKELVFMIVRRKFWKHLP